MVPEFPKDLVCIKFGQNTLIDIDSKVFTRMLQNDGQWHYNILIVTLLARG